MTILLGALDQTIVSVAVPTIARQWGGFEWMAWVISGYLIASTVVTPLYGRFSDLYGRRSVMSFAIGLFLLASVACALAQSLPQLVLARVLQGAGGGGLIAVSQALVADLVTPRERGRYQSYISIVWALASMLGPVVGGLVTEHFSWPWIFWLNLPVGAAALLLVRRSLAGMPVQRGRARIDALGALLLLAALTALLVPVTRVGQGVAWHEGSYLGCWAAGAVLLAVFIVQERRHPQPIVPLALFGNRVVLACSGLLFVCFFIFIALSVLVPLRLQLVAGFGTGEAGLRLLPMTLGIPLAAFCSGRWMYRSGRVLPALRVGVAAMPVSLLLLGAVAPVGWAGMLALLLVGLATGLQLPTSLVMVQQSVPRSMVGTVTAFTAFFRLLGGALGVAVLSATLLLLLRQQAPAGLWQHAEHGLAALLELSHPGAQGGAASAPVDDSAFRWVMWASAALSLLSWGCVARLPDLRLHEGGAAPAEAPAGG